MKNSTLSGSLPKQNSFARFVDEKRNKISDVISALYILLFVYTAISKLQDHLGFLFILRDSPLLKNFANPVAWGVPTVELIAALLLFIPNTRRIGFYIASILMVLFTLYIGYMLAFMPKLPCSCGGIISKMSWKQHLAFNIFFSLLGYWGIRLSKKQKEISSQPQLNDVVFT